MRVSQNNIQNVMPNQLSGFQNLLACFCVRNRGFRPRFAILLCRFLR
jgi:hypothetical protein